MSSSGNRFKRRVAPRTSSSRDEKGPGGCAPDLIATIPLFHDAYHSRVASCLEKNGVERKHLPTPSAAMYSFRKLDVTNFLKVGRRPRLEETTEISFCELNPKYRVFQPEGKSGF